MDEQMDRQTPHDSIDQAYAQHCVAKMVILNQQ